MVIRFRCFRLRLLQSPLPFGYNQVRLHAETIMVIHFRCFQDYFNLLYHPETIKSDGMRRPSWSSTFVVFKTILVSFTIQRQSSLMACGHHHGHPLSLFSIETITVSFTIWIQSSSIACRDHHGHPLSLFSRLF